MLMYYVYVFLASIVVDLLPFFGPPAWTVMVYFQIQYGLNIWLVLVVGVAGSALGRYTLSRYIPYLSDRYLKTEKVDDIKFIGQKLSASGWKVRFFVFLYTLVPLPTTPLFTAAGIARLGAGQFIPSFLLGKFISDAIMVFSADYAARNALAVLSGGLSWQSIVGMLAGLSILVVFLGIDWRTLLHSGKFRLDFRIFK